jgi:ABC-type Fe3+-hydroxamate transport system substrate-binding protein
VALSVDDLGAAVEVRGPAGRIVSLVPSLTESVALTRPGALVGATDWCTHPADLEVTRVRGTKNPDVAKIISLGPDLVLANKEENRRLDVQRLREAGISVWVTEIESVEQALSSLRRMFERALQWPVPDWLDECELVWSRPPPAQQRSTVIAVWRDPWIVVGSSTFTGDVARHLGLVNVFADSAERYPHVEMAEILRAQPSVVLLPDEPYVFTPADGPEAFQGLRCVLLEGRALTWYGPSLVTARATIEAALSRHR